jgi:hypothetical protein
MQRASRYGLDSHTQLENIVNQANTRTGALRALVLVALGAISMTAFAQSADYRHGYEQGYRDGAEAQVRKDGQAGQNGRISIDQATYGTRYASCDARETMQKAIGWRRNVSITANNDLCGDPSPGNPKMLTVTYRCGNTEAQVARAAEGNMLDLNCR